jgi:hypothetical protein
MVGRNFTYQLAGMPVVGLWNGRRRDHGRLAGQLRDEQVRADLRHAECLRHGRRVFAEPPGANPIGTLAALAYMTGDAMVDRYFGALDELLV